MKKLLVLAMLLAACAGAEVESSNAAEAPTPADASIVIQSVDFDAQTMTLRNDGDAEYDLAGHWLCNRPSYVEVAATTIQPGATAEVAVSGIGLDADDGELGIYTSSDFGSAAAIVAYVQWGSADHGRAGTAVEAGVWTTGESLPGGATVITSTGASPNSASDWSG